MKNLILVFAAILFSLNTFAATDSTKVTKVNKKVVTHKRVKTTSYSTNKAHPDGVMLVDSKVMMIKGNKMMKLESDVVLNNGTKVTPEGVCTDKSGTSLMMKEGEHIDMDGKVVIMKKNRRQ